MRKLVRKDCSNIYLLPMSEEFLAQKEKITMIGIVAKPATEDYTKGYYLLPVDSDKITAWFCGSHGSPYHIEGHRSQNMSDIYAPLGTPIYAMADGRVIDIKENSKIHGATPEFIRAGNYVDVIYRNGEFGSMEHLPKNFAVDNSLNVGDSFKAGQKIAMIGNTGFLEYTNSHKGSHVHICIGDEDWVSRKIRFAGLSSDPYLA
jgi:murein DD-endopeptidase MepM/ murein hydrolase activator NlpD